MGVDVQHLRVAIPIFPQVQSLDFVGPFAVLNSLSPDKTFPLSLQLSITCTIVADSLDPVEGANGLTFVPGMTYDEAEKQEWEAVLVPGGSGARPWAKGNERTREFLLKQVPKCKYVLSVCTGSWLLAAIGLLRGHEATTNKAAYKGCVEHTKGQGVKWIPKARWVVSENVWSSSGVTAGIDMAAAFVRYLVSLHITDEKKAKEVGDKLMGNLEVHENDKDDDPWADYYRLV